MSTSHRLRRAGLTALWSALLSLALAVAAPTPAAANFGSTRCGGTPRNCVSLADNGLHTWGPEGTFGNQIPGIEASFVAAMTYYDTHSDIRTMRYPATDRYLDVLVTDYNYGFNNILGWVECIPGSATSGSDPHRRCDRQKLRLNGSYVWAFNTYWERKSLSCHEIGHTLGLRHPATTAEGKWQSCMRTPFDSSYDVYPSSHDLAHLNARY